MIRKILFVFLTVSLLSGMVPAQQLVERGDTYHIQYSDVLALHFRLTPEFNQSVTVDPNGYVYLSGLDSFKAVGLTVGQFQDEVKKVASTRLVDPEVSVTLKEFDKPHIYVGGEVHSPGRFDIRSSLSALDAIALAGGFNDASQKSRVLLLRAGTNTTQVIDLKQLIAQRQLGEAAMLHSGDVLYVTQNKFSKLEKIAHLGNLGVFYNPIP